MVQWNVYEFDGFRFGWVGTVDASRQGEARKKAADMLGGERMIFVPGQPKRRFRVSKAR